MDLLAALPELWPFTALRQSWLVYAAVNSAHILAIGLLVGSIVTFDLRVLGLFRAAPLQSLATALPVMAAWALAAAIVTGFCLFAIRPAAYLVNPAFLVKLGLVTVGIANALAARRARHAVMAGGPATSALRLSAILSLAIWVAAVFAGRLIGFLE